MPQKSTRRLRVESLETRNLLTTLPAGFQETLLSANIDPAGFDIAPDGEIFAAEKHGEVSIFQPDGTKQDTPFYSVAVDEFRDRGLTSVLVDPNYATNHYVYVYYTAAVPGNPGVADNGAVNRLVRLTASTTSPLVADPASAVVILDNIPSPSGIHVGGFLRFGNDGMLYMGVGDADIPANAQDLSNLSGKVLRLNVHDLAHLIPADNPFVGQAGARPEIWAYGFRNPFSGNVNLATHDILVNDVGGSSWEEVDRLVKGGNYGWPTAEGISNDPTFVNPLFTYSHNNAGAAVVGGTFYSGNAFPASYQGQYFFGDLVQGNIRLLDPATGQASVWATDLSFPTDILTGPDGNLYWTQIAPVGGLYKISYVGTANRAPTAVAAADVTSGLLPLTVNFDGSQSTDPDNDTLTYSWDFGDGTTSTGVTAQHTYNVNGMYNAVLTVSDRATGGLSSSAAPIVITVGNNAPVPTITLPLTTDKYIAGQPIQFAGTATDAQDGTLPASEFHWSFLFGHNTHFHNSSGPADGVTSGSIPTPKTGENDPDQYYRIFLTVTDSQGLSTQIFRDIRPVTSTFTLASNVNGANLLLDGTPVAAGTATLGVAGMTRSIEAPLTQTIGGITYNFVGWSDGGTIKHSIDTPTTNATYTAIYRTSAIPLWAAYSSNAPTTVMAGQSVDYQVTVTNTGSQTWLPTGRNKVNLGVYFAGASDAVGAWPQEPVRFGLPHSVAPGQSVTFNVHITAPTMPGTYVLRDRIVKEYVAWFNTMERINVNVLGNTANYSGNVPTVWATKQPQDYTITLTNTSPFVWRTTGHDRVRLGVYFGGPSDATQMGPNAPKLYDLPHDVQAGESVTMTITVSGPVKAGNYILRNRMFKDNYGWFSQMLRTSVSTETLSAQYLSGAPMNWSPGETKTFSVTLINKGSNTWNANGTNQVQLGAYFDGNSDAIEDWNSEPLRVHLPHDVRPGDRITVQVTIKAPSNPGNYFLRLRMVKEYVNWFVPLQKTNVHVG